MEQLASAVRQTAETAAKVSQESERGSQVAAIGGQAVQELGAPCARCNSPRPRSTRSSG